VTDIFSALTASILSYLLTCKIYCRRVAGEVVWSGQERREVVVRSCSVAVALFRVLWVVRWLQRLQGACSSAQFPVSNVSSLPSAALHHRESRHTHLSRVAISDWQR